MNNYIKTDDNVIVNEKHIRWVKKMNECLTVCALQTGCGFGQTFSICKVNSSESYARLNKHFE